MQEVFLFPSSSAMAILRHVFHILRQTYFSSSLLHIYVKTIVELERKNKQTLYLSIFKLMDYSL